MRKIALTALTVIQRHPQFPHACKPLLIHSTH
jgi:hypothetical protein